MDVNSISFAQEKMSFVRLLGLFFCIVNLNAVINSFL